MKAGTTIVVTGFLVPLPATRSESVFRKFCDFEQLKEDYEEFRKRLKKRIDERRNEPWKRKTLDLE